ncbi:molybdate ABC transporter substrate-binding protein [Phaeovulum vinaykumarii]|uniref:Molybdate transport system substrate-binding protein n=1 Tax=Phaeovulum vinaykumarii TaxID=407234 RepID=A0A1N7L8J6_9RHOB|nr:molybdate ABC transporter substrate-binding protein [Phaeovulum vinaykumarii]SIS70165.1 molybdate transport system substrate-binding protein [Phaeovulum vinaykumarii]SOB99080.1 molybdate transport system substrate-binding protein [Phaeovulum vinaykumarii]
MTFAKLSLRAGSAALAALLVLGAPARAAETIAAVAANFTDAATEIGAAFTAATGHAVTFSFGSTGQLYAQITQDAPFEVFLAADQARPEKAEADGLAVPGSRFTYAVGKLVLWSADPTLIDGTEAALKAEGTDHIALADPVTAPYGAAAVEVMEALGVAQTLAPRLVQGKSISQTHQFVATGNATMGFVALSQVVGDETGSRWTIPQDLYSPIRQDAVLLNKGADSEAALAFVDFLKGPQARAIIEKYGYGTGE